MSNNSTTQWLNTLSGTIENTPLSNIDYGVLHLDTYGNDAPGMRIEKERPKISSVDKNRYLNMYGAVPASLKILSEIGGMQSDWRAPTSIEYIKCMNMFRRFVMSSREEKEIILLEKIGFDYSGVIVNTPSGKDTQFVYRYSTEPTQIEIYISQNTQGSITEINRFNNYKMEELKIPLSIEGLTYLFFQIFADMYRVDFNKFNTESLSKAEENILSQILNFESEIPMDSEDLNTILF